MARVYLFPFRRMPRRAVPVASVLDFLEDDASSSVGGLRLRRDGHGRYSRNSLRQERRHPHRLSGDRQRTAGRRLGAGLRVACGGSVAEPGWYVWIGLEVGNMDNSPVDDAAACHDIASGPPSAL